MLLDRKNIETHITLVGWLHIAHSVLLVLVGAFVAALLIGVGTATGDAVAHQILTTVGLIVAGLLLALGLPGLVAGIGLLGRAPWSRVMTLVLAVLELATFPLGTLLGIYAMFVLLQPSAVEAFGPCCEAERVPMQAAGA